MKPDEEFIKKLKLAFIVESKERIQKLSDILLNLEDTTDSTGQMNLIEMGFREVHTLKSGARAVNYIKLEKICQDLENLFHEWKTQKTIPDIKQLDHLHEMNNAIFKWLESNPDEDIEIADEKFEEKEIAEKSDNLSTSELDTVRIGISKIDSLFLQSEEMLSVKLNLTQKTEKFNELKDKIQNSRKEWEKIRISNTIQNAKELQVMAENQFKDLNTQLSIISNELDQELHDFSLKLDNLIEDAKKILMWPFSIILNAFPKIMRDLARKQNKSINVVVEGAEIEIDKRILESLKEVLLHMVRNAIDHGIESPEVRKKLNKPEKAIVQIIVQQLSGNEILIEIRDDGAGVNLEQVKKSAIKQGILTQEVADNLTDKDTLDLIFKSGVSTSPILTELSGRGLGMAIIQEKIEKFSGKVSISTEANRGTSIKIRLPLDIATFKGTLIKVAGQKFIIPTSNIERILRMKQSDLETVENRYVISYEGKTTSVVWLSDVLGLPKNLANELDFVPIVIISDTEKKLGFLFEELLNEQEIIVKNFTKPLCKIPNISSAAILGSGKPIPILNTAELLNNAQNIIAPVHKEKIDTLQETKHILLAEDSITTRNLLKNILELSGYRVTTAVDGMEALELTKTNHFALIVSDVDMPRMNGFELTEQLRKNNQFLHLPIILVTARESEEDRAHGIEVGADAYLTKTSFDSSLMLEIIARLAPAGSAL